MHHAHILPIVVPPTPAHDDTCGAAGPTTSQPVAPSFLHDPAVQVAFHDLSLSFKNFDKCIDNLVRIAEHKVVGRVPNFRFVEDDEPTVTALEPIGTIVDRSLANVLQNMNRQAPYQPSAPWTYNVAGDIFDARGFKLGNLSTRAAAHVVRLVNEGGRP